MELKITNSKQNDFIIIKADTIEKIRKIATEEMFKRDWKEEDCYSEIVEDFC